jgi:hypothetical protein
MLADVAGDHAAPEVKAAARTGADDHLHVFAGEARGLRRGWRDHRCKHGGSDANPALNFHGDPL